MKTLDLNLTRERLYDQVVQQIQAHILSGQLQPGDRLPAERDLAQQLGVSRTVIREAFKTLENKGMVQTLTGSGTYVSEMDGEIVSDSIGLLMQQRGSSFEHLFELRRVLEVEIAGMAAERRTEQDLLLLEQSIRDMQEPLDLLSENPDRSEELIEAHVKADWVFHKRLAVATQNPLFQLILEPIDNQLLDFRIQQALGLTRAMEAGIEDHREILAGVRARDASTCRELMRKHLARAERQWRVVSEREGSENAERV